ncbi:MAG TPA: amidase [Tenuifilaceae bacterium]|nr:amidase [Tenuifilaceae bacterium]
MKKHGLISVVVFVFLLVSLGLNFYLIYSKATLESKVKAAETLFALNFTHSERDSLMEGIEENIEKYKSIHSFQLTNDVAPALIFSPVPLSYAAPDAEISTDFNLPANVNLPENREELCFYSVAELSVLIKNRKITSEELTNLYLDRLARYDSKLHCVITLLGDRALEQARKMDVELNQGVYRGPLHGIPYGVKDLLALKDYPFTWGSPIFREQIAETTSPVIQKLDEAGAVLVAKLSLGELAWGDVWYGGMTRNPWNTETGSSGSSAGSASATAAGLVAFAIGSETWGSIVSPSTVCGVTGLRPTFGRVSRTGAMALSWSMDKIGPICRTAQDCAMVLKSIAGPDGVEPVLADIPFNANLKKDLKMIRVGFVKDYFEGDYPSKKNDSIALETLKNMGVELIPVTLPEHLPVDALSIILDAESAAAFSELTLTNRDDEMVRQIKWAWPNFFRKARFVPAVEYIQANRIRTKLIDEFSELFEQVDVIIAPSFEGNQLLMTNLTGHPALSVPNGFSDEGLPTSFTFISNWYNEQDLVVLGKTYQDETKLYRKIPEGFLP